MVMIYPALCWRYMDAEVVHANAGGHVMPHSRPSDFPTLPTASRASSTTTQPHYTTSNGLSDYQLIQACLS